MPHSPGPFTVEELPDTAERALGLTHVICGPCQIPEEQGEPVAVAFTFSADDAILFASVLDLLEFVGKAVRILDHADYVAEAREGLRLIAKTRGVV